MRTVKTKRTRCLLVQPEFEGRTFWNFSEVCKFAGAKYPDPPLGLLTVAAMLPVSWDLKLLDVNAQTLHDEVLEWADIVLTGGMLQQRRSILELINRAHGKSKTVAVGGSDPTSHPEVYNSADFLFLGEGEETVPLFIEDLGRNVSSGEYKASKKADMNMAVVPRYDLVHFSDYLHMGVQFSRGCPYNCEFCDIAEKHGRIPRTKTSRQVIKEMESFYNLGYRGQIAFVDDNFIGDKSKAAGLLFELRDWSKRKNYPFFFNVQTSINLSKEPNLLELMKSNDFRSVCIGIETQDQKLLDQINKKQNRGVSVVDAVRTFNSYGLDVIGCFILGFDKEPRDIAAKTIQLIQKTGICMSMVTTLIALPNTRLAERLAREGRLFSEGKSPALTLKDGLNFVTTRSHADIFADQIKVLGHIYNAREYFKRLVLTAIHLKPEYKFRHGFSSTVKSMWIFVKASCKIGFQRRNARHYWRAIFTILIRNPKAIEAAGRLSIIYLHLYKHSNFIIDTMKTKISQIESLGENEYNRMMTGGGKRGFTG